LNYTLAIYNATLQKSQKKVTISPMQNNKPKVIGAIAIAAIVIASGVAWAMGKNGTTDDQNSDTNGSSQAVADRRIYKDGTYSADGQYVSPAGEEQVGVTLTIANDVVTSATFEGKAENPGSVIMQGKFAEGFEGQVVGKPIDQISLGVVNGSSLTPKGFMDAVEKIKLEARA
jgi:hypothetical protein